MMLKSIKAYLNYKITTCQKEQHPLSTHKARYTYIYFIGIFFTFILNCNENRLKDVLPAD